MIENGRNVLSDEFMTDTDVFLFMVITNNGGINTYLFNSKNLSTLFFKE